MIHYKVKMEPIANVEYIECDICGCKYDNEMDLQEFHHIDFTGGYSSVFGDMTRIKCDICQDCLKNMIGDSCYFETVDGLVRFKP